MFCFFWQKTASPIESEVPVIGSSVEDIADQADDHTLKSPVEGQIKFCKKLEVWKGRVSINQSFEFEFPQSFWFSETDSESIETISDDECLVSHPLANSIHANLASFCYIPGGSHGNGEIWLFVILQT